MAEALAEPTGRTGFSFDLIGLYAAATTSLLGVILALFLVMGSTELASLLT